MNSDFPNPSDRFPSSFVMTATSVTATSTGRGAPRPGDRDALIGYGDPFAGEIAPLRHLPRLADMNMPGGTLISRIEERGILKG
jgi:hypothetical protein